MIKLSICFSDNSMINSSIDFFFFWNFVYVFFFFNFYSVIIVYYLAIECTSNLDKPLFQVSIWLIICQLWSLFGQIHTQYFCAKYWDKKTLKNREKDIFHPIFFSCVTWKYLFLTIMLIETQFENILKCHYNILKKKIDTSNTTVSLRKTTTCCMESHIRHVKYQIFIACDLTRAVINRGFTAILLPYI